MNPTQGGQEIDILGPESATIVTSLGDSSEIVQTFRVTSQAHMEFDAMDAAIITIQDSQDSRFGTYLENSKLQVAEISGEKEGNIYRPSLHTDQNHSTNQV